MEWFEINGQKTVFDKCFIANDISPSLFTVRTKNNKLYIVECIDEENYIYYICETSDKELLAMQNNEITLRALFLNKKEMYKAIKCDKDISTAMPIEEFNPKYLPFDNNYYKSSKFSFHRKAS